MRYAIYDPSNGIIRAVVRHSKKLAERNKRPGEAMLACPTQFISSALHCIRNGEVVAKPVPDPVPAVVETPVKVVEVIEGVLDKLKGKNA